MKLKKQVFFLLILWLMAACSSSPTEQSESEEIEAKDTEMTAEAKLEAAKEALLEDEVVKEYFDTLEEAIDEYMKMLLKMTEQAAQSEKDGSAETNPIGALGGMMGTMIESGNKMAELSKKMDALKEKADALRANLDEEKEAAFIAMYSKIMLRMAEAASREADSMKE